MTNLDFTPLARIISIDFLPSYSTVPPKERMPKFLISKGQSYSVGVQQIGHCDMSGREAL